MATKRQQSSVTTLLEASTGGGAAVGLLLAAMSAAKHPPLPARCTAKAAGQCLGQQTSAMLQPYLIGGLVGAAVGLGIGVLLVVMWNQVRKPRAPASRLVLAGVPAQPADQVQNLGRPRRQAIPERVRHEVWRRDEACCVDCGSRERLEFDHIIPVSKGGSNTARNIELRCERCNAGKGARI